MQDERTTPNLLNEERILCLFMDQPLSESDIKLTAEKFSDLYGYVHTYAFCGDISEIRLFSMDFMVQLAIGKTSFLIANRNWNIEDNCKLTNFGILEKWMELPFSKNVYQLELRNKLDIPRQVNTKFHTKEKFSEMKDRMIDKKVKNEMEYNNGKNGIEKKSSFYVGWVDPFMSESNNLSNLRMENKLNLNSSKLLVNCDTNSILEELNSAHTQIYDYSKDKLMQNENSYKKILNAVEKFLHLINSSKNNELIEMKKVIEKFAPKKVISESLLFNWQLINDWEIDYKEFWSIYKEILKIEPFKTLKERLDDSKLNWDGMIKEHSSNLEKKMIQHLNTEFNNIVVADEWLDEHTPPTESSMRTFFKLIEKLNPKLLPEVGCDDDGRLTMSWYLNDQLSSFTCLPNDLIWWHVKYERKKKIEYSVGQCELRKLDQNLKSIDYRKVIDFEL